MRWVGKASPGTDTSLLLHVLKSADTADNKRSKKCRKTFSVLKEAGEERCQLSHRVPVTNCFISVVFSGVDISNL